MFWETASAVIFLVALFYFWFPLSILWGIGVFVFRLFVSFISALDSTNFISAFLASFVAAIVSGFDAFTDIPVWLWEWAKFSHPWWAFIISTCSFVFIANRD